MVSFGEGLKYPWGKPKRLWNILWILVPIYGWFALGGYIVNIVTSLVNGNKSEYPEFGSSLENFKLGFIIFIKYLPLIIVLVLISYILSLIPYLGALVNLFITYFIVPYLVINLFVKRTVGASFEIKNAWDAMSKNFGEYLIALIFTIIYSVIYVLLSFVLVGIPCLLGSYVYLADFYSKYKK